MKLINELRTLLAACARDLRGRRDWPALNDNAATVAIVDDIQKEQGRAGHHAYSAEQADLEAARTLEAAQRPESPGGVNITPAELRPALRHIHNSARHDRQAHAILL